MAGFEESNGTEGWPEFDWMSKPEGDRALAAKYFKAAGYASGKYEGGETLLLVADNAEPDKSIAQITEAQLNEMGFKTKLRLVTRDTMLTRFCQVSGSEVNVCPSFGWAQDFNDPQTVLDPTFDGKLILEASNVNWSELDDPGVNAAIEKAKTVVEPGRARAGVGRRQQGDRRARAGDPVHVGLPVRRRVAERPRRAERLLDDLGLELHVDPLSELVGGRVVVGERVGAAHEPLDAPRGGRCARLRRSSATAAGSGRVDAISTRLPPAGAPPGRRGTATSATSANVRSSVAASARTRREPAVVDHVEQVGAAGPQHAPDVGANSAVARCQGIVRPPNASPTTTSAEASGSLAQRHARVADADLAGPGPVRSPSSSRARSTSCGSTSSTREREPGRVAAR